MTRSKIKEFNKKASEYNHAFYKLGCEEFDRANFKNAVKAFSESLDYWPEDPKAWLALGNCYDELNHPVKAEECYRKALSLESETNKDACYYNLGNSLLDQSKFDEAIMFYKLASAQSKPYNLAQINMERAKNGISTKNS